MRLIKILIVLLCLSCASAFAQPQTNVATLPVNYGGAQKYRNISLAATAQSVSPTVANLYGWHLFNGAATTRYWKFYDEVASSVVVGTTVPFLTIPIPAGAGANVSFPIGIAFRKALSVVCVTGVADSNTTAPAANECITNVFYKNN